MNNYCIISLVFISAAANAKVERYPLLTALLKGRVTQASERISRIMNKEYDHLDEITLSLPAAIDLMIEEIKRFDTLFFQEKNKKSPNVVIPLSCSAFLYLFSEKINELFPNNTQAEEQSASPNNSIPHPNELFPNDTQAEEQSTVDHTNPTNSNNSIPRPEDISLNKEPSFSKLYNKEHSSFLEGHSSFLMDYACPLNHQPCYSCQEKKENYLRSETSLLKEISLLKEGLLNHQPRCACQEKQENYMQPKISLLKFAFALSPWACGLLWLVPTLSEKLQEYYSRSLTKTALKKSQHLINEYERLINLLLQSTQLRNGTNFYHESMLHIQKARSVVKNKKHAQILMEIEYQLKALIFCGQKQQKSN